MRSTIRRRAAVAALLLAGQFSGCSRDRASGSGGGAPRGAEARGTLDVFAAASLADAFTALGRRMERENPGLTVRFNFAGSQQLATQIEHGARADVFASADQRWMDYVAHRMLLAGEAERFVRNRLVVITPEPSRAGIDGLRDLAGPGVKVVVAAEAVPVGRYSRQALRNLSAAPGFAADYAGRVLANVVSEEENVKAVVAKVRLGEADAGIVYRSDVTPAARGRVRVVDIPDAFNVTASYPIAVLRDASNGRAARRFVELVLSGEGQRVLSEHGFVPLNAPARAAAAEP